MPTDAASAPSPLYFDERLRIPEALLARLPAAVFAEARWLPAALCHGDTLLVAAVDPADPAIRQAIAGIFPEYAPRFVVASALALRRLAADFAPSVTGAPVGVVRTNLAHWRNTMALWRTRLACWRTDMATGRTWLNAMRFGLGLTALGNTLLRTAPAGGSQAADIACLGLGLVLAAVSGRAYLRLRLSRHRLPGVQTLVEVSAATLQFLEEYHFIEDGRRRPASRHTMLARLGDMLEDHATILEIASGAPERIHLARERNVLAAQRTVCACYRTIAARARTGLAFIRTGVALLGLGLGLLQYFGGGLLSLADWLLAVAGAAMIVDGLLWYWPVRKEPVRTPRCMDPAECRS
uniref:GSPII_E-like protein n=1 Tax=Desulfovibrio sp. U5L TaxID=596152 RepID=I2PYK2_9BACT